LSGVGFWSQFFAENFLYDSLQFLSKELDPQTYI